MPGFPDARTGGLRPPSCFGVGPGVVPIRLSIWDVRLFALLSIPCLRNFVYFVYFVVYYIRFTIEVNR